LAAKRTVDARRLPDFACQEDRAENSDGDADEQSYSDNHQGSQDRVSKTAVLLERRRRKLGERRDAELAPSSPQQQPHHGEQRDQR
jgi:hypothetical protein